MEEGGWKYFQVIDDFQSFDAINYQTVRWKYEVENTSVDDQLTVCYFE